MTAIASNRAEERTELGMAPLCDDDVHVWLVSTPEAVDLGWESVALLDEAELARARKFRLHADRLRFVAGRTLLRRVLGAYLDMAPETLTFSRRCRHCGCDQGKPRLATVDHPKFSLSHSGQWIGLAIAASTEVGLDIESVRRGLYGSELVGTLMTTQERQALDRLPADRRAAGFFRCWTRKEAILKATGYGLTVNPSTVVVTCPDEAPRLLRWTSDRPLSTAVRLADISVDECHSGSVAVLSDHPRRLLILHGPGSNGPTSRGLH